MTNPPIINTGKPPCKFDFVEVSSSLEASAFLERRGIAEGWVFRADSRMFVAWETKCQS